MQLFKKITVTFLLFVTFASVGTPHVNAVVDIGTFKQPASGFTIPTNVQTAPSAPVKGGTPAPAPAPVNGGTPAPAAQGNSGTGDTIVNPLKGISDLPSFLKVVLGAMIQLAEVALVLAFVWIGFLFVKAQGAPAEIKKARDAFFWTVIGGLILLSANAILSVVQSTASSLSN